MSASEVATQSGTLLSFFELLFLSLDQEPGYGTPVPDKCIVTPDVVHSLEGEAEPSGTAASEDVLESGEPAAKTKDKDDLCRKRRLFLENFCKIGGQFLWFHTPVKVYPAGLDEEACGHPFLVVDYQTSDETDEALLGVCMIRSFSSMSPEKGRKVADEKNYLIPIWPNGKSPSAKPSVVYMEDKKSTPRLSWVNASRIFYVKESCFETSRRGVWEELRLRKSCVFLIRGLLQDNPTSRIEEIPLESTNSKAAKPDEKVQKKTTTSQDLLATKTVGPAADLNRGSSENRTPLSTGATSRLRRRKVGLSSTASALPPKAPATSPIHGKPTASSSATNQVSNLPLFSFEALISRLESPEWKFPSLGQRLDPRAIRAADEPELTRDAHRK